MAKVAIDFSFMEMAEEAEVPTTRKAVKAAAVKAAPIEAAPEEDAADVYSPMLEDEDDDGLELEDIDLDDLDGLLLGTEADVDTDKALANLERNAKHRAARRASPVEVSQLEDRADIQARIMAERPSWSDGSFAEPQRDEPEWMSVDEQRKLAHMWFLSARSRNGCSIEKLYTMRIHLGGDVTCRCLRCKNNVTISDMHEVSGFSTSYVDYVDCPQCGQAQRKLWDLPEDERPAARAALMEWCEDNTKYDERTGKAWTCEGKGQVMKFRFAWGHFLCQTCVVEHEARARGGAPRYT